MKTLVQIHSGDGSLEEAGAKEQALFANLSRRSSLLVALSGGTDSAYLAWAANTVLGDRALSVTAISPSYSAYDREQLEIFLHSAGIRHEYVQTNEMDNPLYRANTADRCYYCKDELFAVLDRIAANRKIEATAYGVNADDTFDFRPGHRAATEHKVLTPLLAARLYKSEIRFLSERANLPSWNRPASACLSSRLPYGTEVTEERLTLVEKGEQALRELGFRQFRVRLHDRLARIELAPEELERGLAPEMAASMAKSLKAVGFSYVSLDLEGYRQGSLNEALSKSAKAAGT
ncbi:MAG TPA: ATP-dependent sacrificial sulfur transferase LarE [Candidatus Acidoferrum sp.]|nr:ATP-dependent sacrificial sulfur transferase LarE [Candidatus Acidoferrum sp.]